MNVFFRWNRRKTASIHCESMKSLNEYGEEVTISCEEGREIALDSKAKPKLLSSTSSLILCELQGNLNQASKNGRLLSNQKRMEILRGSRQFKTERRKLLWWRQYTQYKGGYIHLQGFVLSSVFIPCTSLYRKSDQSWDTVYFSKSVEIYLPWNLSTACCNRKALETQLNQAKMQIIAIIDAFSIKYLS